MSVLITSPMVSEKEGVGVEGGGISIGVRGEGGIVGWQKCDGGSLPCWMLFFPQLSPAAQ